MVNPTRREVSITDIDLNDTRLKFRMNFKEDAIKAKADSIQKIGLINPIKLWKMGDHHTIIAGWQRLTATISLEYERVDAEVYEGITYEEAIRIAIADNHLRENLTDYETALQMQTPRREGYPVEKLAEMYGCGVDRVYDLLNVADMDAGIRTALENDQLSLYQAVTISRFPYSERSEILDRTIAGGLPVKKLKHDLAKLKNHPLYRQPLPVEANPEVIRHALKIPTSQGFSDIQKAYWEILGKHQGLPRPNKCEFTLSIIAQGCDPPYVCEHDAEWVVLAYGKFPHGDVENFDWEEVPLKERDGWFFYCERCAKLVFPDIVFHRGMSYRDWQEEYANEEALTREHSSYYFEG
jgi:hypothetical protein